jgi:hypothetical protein
MKLHFPIDLVEIQIVDKLSDDTIDPIYTTQRLKISETDFRIKIEYVARYCVQNGSKIQVLPEKDADQASVQLFLNGSVLGAVLHQKGIIPFHGSSFEYQGKRILICGHSGVGKSSITAAFCQNGAHFINDDITPISFANSFPIIIPIRTEVKLWDDTLQALQIENKNNKKIRPSIDKFYVPLLPICNEKKQLDTIVVLSTHNDEAYKVIRPTGIDKYKLIKKNIYRKMYLRGMPQTEKSYFQQLLRLAGCVDIIQVFRPKISDIYSTTDFIRKQLLP